MKKRRPVLAPAIDKRVSYVFFSQIQFCSVFKLHQIYNDRKWSLRHVAQLSSHTKNLVNFFKQLFCWFCFFVIKNVVEAKVNKWEIDVRGRGRLRRQWLSSKFSFSSSPLLPPPLINTTQEFKTRSQWKSFVCRPIFVALLCYQREISFAHIKQFLLHTKFSTRSFPSYQIEKEKMNFDKVLFLFKFRR